MSNEADLPSGDPQPGYPQPSYAPPGYAQPSYAPPGYAQPGYAQPGYPPPTPPLLTGPATTAQISAGGSALVPLRPLTLSDILDGGFRVIRRSPRSVLGISALMAILQAAIIAAYQLLAGSMSGSVNLSNLTSGIRDDGTSNGASSFVANLGGTMLSIAAGVVFGAILTGLLSVMIADDVLGRPVSIGTAWDRLRPKLPGLFGLSLLVGLGESAALLLGVLPGMFLWGVWAVAVPAYVLEQGGVFTAFSRSWALILPDFARVWGIRALGWFVVSLVSSLIQLPAVIVGVILTLNSDHPSLSVLVLFSSIGAVLSGTVLAPVRCAIDVLLYVDARMRREGLDITLQQQPRVGY